MFSIIRKDLGWLLIFLILGLVQLITLLMGRPFEDLWIRPDCAPFMDLHRLCSLGGLVLGVFAAIREEISRTEEYVRHRPVSALRLYWVKVLGCILVMLAWLIIPTILSLSKGFWSENAQLTRYSMILKYMGTGVVAFSSFSVGLFAGTLRLSLVKRIIIGILGYISLMYLSYILTMQTFNEGGTSVFVYGCVHLSVSALLLYSTYWNFVPTYDLDRPVVNRTVRFGSSITVFVVAITIGIWISDRQNDVQINLLSEYPSILRSSEPKLIHTDRNQKLKDSYLEVNERHEPVGEFDNPRDEDGRPHFPPHWQLEINHHTMFKYHRFPYSNTNSKFLFGEEVSYFDQGWKRLQTLGRSSYLYLYQPEGMIYYFRYFNKNDYRGDPSVPMALKLGVSSGRGHFSRNTMSLSNGLPREAFMLVDWDDGGIWYCDLNKGDDHFRRISLPDGDRLKDYDFFHKGYFKDRINVQGGYAALHYDNFLGLVGEKGNYVWKGDKFVKINIDLNNNDKKSIDSNRTVIDKQVYRELDPISPEVAIMDDDNNIIFTHRFGLYRNEELWQGLKLYAYSLLRSHVIQLISFFGISDPRVSFRSKFLIDPLLASGKRFWLLATNLLFSGCLAFLAVWRLIRFNAERSRLLYWGIIIFLSGIGGYLVYRLFETKRAYRISPVVLPEEAPPMVIQSV